jgi:PII-like signaling protein
VQVCKRDGRLLAVPEVREGGWQKLMVYCSEQSRHHGGPLYRELIRRLRAAGAAGATAVRGVWGYHGDHRPHGDTFWQLQRRVPVVVVIVDTPANIRRWFEIVDELTGETGLVTSELVPVAQRTHSTAA